MAGWLGSALAQEAVSRGVSFGLSRREEKASQGHLMERLEMAVSQLEFALERAQELPIRHLSLLGRRKMIKCAYLEAMELLDRHKQQRAVSAEQELQDAHGVKKRKRWVISAKNLLTTSSFAGFSTDDVRRFEWYADCAGKFVSDLESGCSLYHYTFCNPTVRHLLQGKTLWYSHLDQGNLIRGFYIWPVYSDERGVEAVLLYHYKDSTVAEKCFSLSLSLRLSESTDIVGVATKGFQLLTSGFKLAAECAMGELTLLSNLQDIAHSNGPPRVGIQDLTKFFRGNPTCCKGSSRRTYPNNNVSLELADIFPEQVICFSFWCHIPALERPRTRSSFDECWTLPLVMRVIFGPHLVDNLSLSILRFNEFMDSGGSIELLESGASKYSYAVERIGKNNRKPIDVSLPQVAETLKLKAINCFSRQPELTDYRIDWYSEHGCAWFDVKKASMGKAGAPKIRRRYNTRGSTRRSSRR